MSVSAATLIERAKGIRNAGGFEKGNVNSIALSPDGRLMAEALYSRTIRLWDIQTRSLLWTRENHQCFSLAFSPVGRVLACAGKARHDKVEGNDYSISLCDVTTGETKRCLTGHNLYVNCITFSRDGRLLASASDDSTVRLWELHGYDWVKDEVRRRSFSGHTDTVRSVSISPAGRLASASRDNTVRVWDIKTHACLRTESQPDARIVAYSPNGQMLAVNSQSRDLSVMEAETGRLLHQLQHPNEIRAWCWSPDSSVLAVELGVISGQKQNLQGRIVLWHVESEVAIYAEEWERGTTATSYLNPIAISPDGRFLAASLFTEEVNGLHLWDISALGVGVGPERAREKSNVPHRAVALSESMRAHLRSLPLSHATLPTPARPAQWLRSAAAAGGRPPLCIVRDLGALLTQPRQHLMLERPSYLPPGVDTSAYLNLLKKMAANPLLREVSGWDISESMAGVVIARLLAGLSFPEIYGLPGGVGAINFAQQLGAALNVSDMATIWRQTELTERPNLNELLPMDALARIEANLRRLDAEELRFLHRYGPRFAGTPDPREMLDLFNLLDLPPSVRLALTQVLRLLPRVSQVMSKSGGMQTYAMGGYAGLTHKGSLDSLVPTELAYPSEMFLHRLLNQEALYYGRESEQERQREVAYIVTQAGLDVRGDVDVMARALTLALVEAMQGRGYEVQQSFVGSSWTEPAEMLRAADVQRVLYYRDENALRPRSMLSSVLGQLRAWRERYRGLHVIWVVGEHWDADDREENQDLYAALRAGANHQAWFIRLGAGGGRAARPREPVAARDFGRSQVIDSDLMWARQEQPVLMYVAPVEDETTTAVEEKWVEPVVPPSRVMMITHRDTRYSSELQHLIWSGLRERGHTIMADSSLTSHSSWVAALRDVSLVIALVTDQSTNSSVISSGMRAARALADKEGRPRVLLVREVQSVQASDALTGDFKAAERFTWRGPQDNEALLRAIIEGLAPEPSPLRFDGLYHQASNQRAEQREWFKFLSSGAVISVTTTEGTPEQVERWIDEEFRAGTARVGSYRADGPNISLNFAPMRGEYQTRSYRGTVRPDGLSLDVFLNAWHQRHTDFQFTAIAGVSTPLPSPLRFDGAYATQLECVDPTHPEKDWSWMAQCLKFNEDETFFHQTVWDLSNVGELAPGGSAAHGTYTVNGDEVEMAFRLSTGDKIYRGKFQGDVLHVSGTFAGEYSFHEAHATATGLRFDGVYTCDEMWMNNVHPDRGGRERFTFKFNADGSVYFTVASVWGDVAPEIRAPGPANAVGTYSVEGTWLRVDFRRDDNTALHFSGSIDGETIRLTSDNETKRYQFVHDRDIRA